MSESMAFIGGVAVAGLAALVLLKGTGNPVQSGFVPPQIQAPIVPQQVIPQQFGQYGYPGQQGVIPNPVPNAPNDQQLRLESERIKMQVDTLQRDNERLKVENQQMNLQLQAFAQQRALQDQQNQQRNAIAQAQSPWWSSGILWAVGGMALTVGGGIVVAGVSSLFSQKPRPVRTVQVVHPYTGPTPPLAPTRRAEFLPPRNEVRRVETHEYDDTY
ncbi:heterocyst differentiation related protein [Calothrix sp. NIES-4071]|nr:heterocyst differentiation related protein [Calothrix sp. NIES-4071]BAZ61390.1 heterocyst differentiation related protein [Calothrix sp. NIES-4105]